MKQDLVLITNSYPYGKGGNFLIDEIKKGYVFFRKIYIVSMSWECNEIKGFLPNNAEVINARRSRYEITILIKSLIRLLEYKNIEDIIFANKLYKQIDILKNVKKIYIHIYFEEVLKRVFKDYSLNNMKNTLYYSYWLSSSAVFLANFHIKYPETYCISRAHGYDCFIDRGYIPFRKMMLNNLNEVHSISSAGLTSLMQLSKYLNKEHANLYVSRLGIINEDVPEIKRRRINGISIVSCSNINKIKRLDIIIDALSELSINVEWTHYGDGELSNYILKYAKNKLNNKKNIKYVFKGYQSKECIMRSYKNNSFDYFINCSDKEGIPVSIMEAISCGIPVICRNVGGNSEIVSDGYNGFLLEKNSNYQDYQRVLMKANGLSDSEYREMCASARDIYKERYSAELNYHLFYSTVLNRMKQYQA